MNSKIEIRDFITVGIFAALYFVMFFTAGMIGYIPVLMPLVLAVALWSRAFRLCFFLPKCESPA
jgi:energy-coupling factor transport system substrate-specific component